VAGSQKCLYLRVFYPSPMFSERAMPFYESVKKATLYGMVPDRNAYMLLKNGRIFKKRMLFKKHLSKNDPTVQNPETSGLPKGEVA